MLYLDGFGPQNTQKTLAASLDECKKRGIKYIVVASTYGETAREASEIFKDTDIRLVIVTHNTGFEAPGKQQFDPAAKELVEASGGVVFTGTHVLRGLGRALRDKNLHSEEEAVANTLRIFGQGTKVCIEIAAMACDAGLIPPTNVICVAGTGRGADTSLLIKAQPSNNFFNIKVLEILVKPRDF